MREQPAIQLINVAGFPMWLAASVMESNDSESTAMLHFRVTIM